MTEIVMRGCDAAHFPLSALAAFGVLRLLTEAHTLVSDGEPPRLSWQEMPRWTPIMQTQLSEEDVIATLMAAISRSVSSPLLSSFAHKQSVTVTSYRELLQFCMQTEDEAMSTALACEWPMQKNGTIQTTPFIMTSGHQNWFAKIQEAAALCLKRGPAVMQEVLFGPWRYQDELHPLGWDPLMERQHAFTHEAPTKMDKQSVVGATWLAAESLAFFPCLGEERSAQTVCFAEHVLVWPMWRAPLTMVAVRALLRLPLTSGRRSDSAAIAASQRELRTRGIAAVYTSRRKPVGSKEYYGIFCPAEVLWDS